MKDAYGRVIKEGYSWSDVPCVVRCGHRAIDNEDDVFLGHLVAFCPEVQHWSNRWNRSDVQAVKYIFQRHVYLYYKIGN